MELVENVTFIISCVAASKKFYFFLFFMNVMNGTYSKWVLLKKLPLNLEYIFLKQVIYLHYYSGV